MPRRSRDNGPSLESDSFLDIVANIVGILIILIVIAGVRVGQSAAQPLAPVVSTQPEPTSALEPLAVAPRLLPIPEPLPAPRPLPVVAPRPVLIAAPTPEPPPLRQASPALLAAIAATREEIARQQAEAARLNAEVGRLDLALVEVSAGTGTLAADAAVMESRGAAADDAARRIAAEVEALQGELTGLNRQITDTPSENVTVLRRPLNPIGREVEGQELHFRLAAGQVARLPIDELITRARPQIERQVSWIAKGHTYRGVVGPVAGFQMTYVVERKESSALSLRGTSTISINFTGWKVEPDTTYVGETAAQALRSDSRFVTALRLAERGTALTFWVYPDSFELYQQLEGFAHAEGFRVAARPLPFGVPIAGSPQGSRSASQ